MFRRVENRVSCAHSTAGCPANQPRKPGHVESGPSDIYRHADGDVESFTLFVTRGRGLASSIRSQDVRIISRSSGKNLAPGSLNLFSTRALYVNKTTAFLKIADNYYWPAKLLDIPIYISVWDDGPAHVFEVFSEHHLRSTLNLNDGDRVAVKVDSSFLDWHRTKLLKNKVSWMAAWRYREPLYYTSNAYQRLIEEGRLRRYLWRSRQY